MVTFFYRVFIEPDKKKALAAVILILLVTGPFLFYKFQRRAIAEKQKPMYVRELPTGRMAIWLVGIEIIKENPIFGSGMGGFPIAFDKEYQEHRIEAGYVGYRRVGHNDFITIMAEYGIVGLLLWFGILIYALRESYRLNAFFIRKGDGYLTAVAGAISCALVALLLCQGFLGLYLSKFFWLAVVFVPVLRTIARKAYGASDAL